MSYRYDEELEKLYVSEAENLKKPDVIDVIITAMRRAEEPLGNLDPWSESTVRFVVSPADGIADYVYDNETKSRFRGPMFRIMPVLIKRGDIALLKGPGKLIKKARVINELEKMLSEARRELESLEKKPKKRKSKYLEERRLFLEAETARITRALEYLTH